MIYNPQILRDQLANSVSFMLPRCEVNYAGGICHFPRRDLDLSASAVALLAGCGRDGFAIVVMHRALAVSAARGSQRRSVEACHLPAPPSPSRRPPPRHSPHPHLVPPRSAIRPEPCSSHVGWGVETGEAGRHGRVRVRRLRGLTNTAQRKGGIISPVSAQLV